MSGPLFPFFPEGTFASAVTTTVWIGVWVVVFYNLRLGWSVSGLIVPGYLVPLLFIKPMAAAVVLGEGVLTYLIVKTICSGREVKPWTSFFGRDRFFAMLVVTILVRCVFDGWALPWVADWVTQRFDYQLAFRDDMHSFGLIIVSLVANYFWRPGLRRGAIPLSVTIGTTFLIVRFILVDYTNFSLGNLQYMYEDIAASLLASPKAYIVLITTAYIASWMNLHYGWEFSGILIPALLALQWYLPMKILTTFVETFLILAIASLVLRMPPFSRMNMEGSRKTLLFFNIAFAFRLLLGHTVPIWFPEVKVTDLYGFGYLLSTLLAVRIHAMGILLRVPRVSIQVSIIGALAGSVLGFAMTLLPGAWTWTSDQSLAAESVSTARADQTLVDWLRAEKPRLYRQRLPNSYVVPNVADLTRFSEGLDLLIASCRDDGTEEEIARARSLFNQANYDLLWLEDRYWVLAEKEPTRGWGMYTIDRERFDQMLIEVPAPIDEWASAEAGTAIFLRVNGGALAIGGSGLNTNRDGSADVLNRPQSIFATFHRALGYGNILQIRGLTPSIRRRIRNAAGGPDSSSLWVKGSLPKGLDLRDLETALGQFPILWRPTPLPNALRDLVWSGNAELILTMRDRARLQSAMITLGAAEQSVDVGRVSPRLAHVAPLLRDLKENILPRGIGGFEMPTSEILLYLDEEVFRPLTAIAMSGHDFHALTDIQRDRVAAVASAARSLGYHLEVVHDDSCDADFLILAERPALKPGLQTASSSMQRTSPLEQSRQNPGLQQTGDPSTDPMTPHGWGTYAFRMGEAANYAVEVPRPLAEQQTYEYGITLFNEIDARVLMLAGAHPRANLDDSADVTRTANAANLFNLVRQVVLREVDPKPWRQVQVRASKTPGDRDVLLAPANPTIDIATWFSEVLEHLEREALTVRHVDGAQDTAGYEFDNLFLKRALRLSTNGESLILWLSPKTRRHYRAPDENTLQMARFTALGIPTVETSLASYLVVASANRPMQLSNDDRRLLVEYLETRDIVLMRTLQHRWADAHWVRLIDTETGSAFLLIGTGDTILTIRLAELISNAPEPLHASYLLRSTIERFAKSRASWLEAEHRPEGGIAP